MTIMFCYFVYWYDQGILFLPLDYGIYVIYFHIFALHLSWLHIFCHKTIYTQYLRIKNRNAYCQGQSGDNE
jgi:hypothetical protein